MSASAVFRRIVAVLEDAGIPYMLVGSFASAYHGTPRATQDIDIVIAPTAQQVHRLVSLLPETEYYVDLAAALDALRRQSLFNVVDMATGWKIDLIIRKTRAFSQVEFERRQPAEVEGVRLDLASAEDVILTKLEWARLAGSERQIEDAAGILRIRGEQLDHEYLGRWLTDLGLEEEWRQASEKARVPDTRKKP